MKEEFDKEKGSAIKIYEATGGDVEGIREVRNITWAETYPNAELGITKEMIWQRFELTDEAKERLEKQKETINTNPNTHTWVAKDGVSVVGFCYATKEGPNKIGALYVLPGYQGKGVGSRLIKASFSWFGESQDIYVGVASYNQPAINFYEKVGFVKTGNDLEGDVAPFSNGAVIPEIEMVRRKNAN